MKEFIKQYYLPPFLFFLVLLGIQALGLRSPNTVLENVLIIVAGALFLALTIGTLYYLVDTKWGPARRKRKFQELPFKELLENGFRKEKDLLLGVINGYTVIILYTWPGGRSAIKIDILFDPASRGHWMTGADMDQLEKRYKKANTWSDHSFDWTRNSIGHTIEYSFLAPKYERIKRKIEEMTAILKKEGLRPISFEDNEKITPELARSMERDPGRKSGSVSIRNDEC